MRLAYLESLLNWMNKLKGLSTEQLYGAPCVAFLKIF